MFRLVCLLFSFLVVLSYGGSCGLVCGEYVAIVLTRSTIAAIRISVYSPLNIVLDATPTWYQATYSVLPPPSSLFCPLPVQ